MEVDGHNLLEVPTGVIHTQILWSQRGLIVSRIRATRVIILTEEEYPGAEKPH